MGYAGTVEDAGNPRFVAAHARYVSERTGAEADQFARMLLRWAWPGGLDDRFDPDTAGWLRHRRPELTPRLAACACVEGRCTVCN
jgi:hypothetical protein